ncbi:MAG: 4-(cytidine 5'-diphospho)-2-C-methyl-D-erythritol kinase [Rhodobacteraceae bacterium]|nr:4-(cytidine 5'-diphospho)-2-C-methyl-D-erythritol kinase [Paracoccaceae bacterium]
MKTVRAAAPAKINLTLHITGQRPDGYHLLDSLVAFAKFGDYVTIQAGNTLSLTVEGPEAKGVPSDMANLALKAAALYKTDAGAALTLRKFLPAASGIGGGSSDAAAALRGLSHFHDLPLPDADAILALGADVPVCVAARTARMTGIGDQVDVLPDLPETDIVLVNPRVGVATAAVFGALESKSNAPMPDAIPPWNSTEDLCLWLRSQRNDLEAPALSHAPVIADCLASLNEFGALFARMSGSGATCFGLFESDGFSAKSARKFILDRHPDWWVVNASLLRREDLDDYLILSTT